MLGHEIGLSGTEQNVRLGTVQNEELQRRCDVHVTLQNGTVHFHFCVHMPSTGQWRSLLSIVTIGGPLGKWKCHLRAKPVESWRSSPDPTLKHYALCANGMKTVTLRLSTWFGSSAEHIRV